MSELTGALCFLIKFGALFFIYLSVLVIFSIFVSMLYETIKEFRDRKGGEKWTKK